MHNFPIARARAGFTGLTAALAMFGLLSSPIGFNPPPRAYAEILTPAAPHPYTQVDDVLIDEPGYKLGGAGYVNGSPAEPAEGIWTQAWFGSTFELKGKFHFDGAERCVRAQLISYDEFDVEISPRDFSDVKCPADLGHNVRDITDGGSDGVSARVGASKVKVTLQTQNTNGTWSNAGSRTVAFGPVLEEDDVLIQRDRVDLGLGNLVNGNPSAPASLEWKSDGSAISAILRATLFVKDSHDLCFRTHVGYKKHDGTLLEDPRHGDEHCVETDALHTFPVNMGGAFSHNELAEVTYAIEQKGGSGVWETLGQTTLELGDAGVVINTNPGGPILP